MIASRDHIEYAEGAGRRAEWGPGWRAFPVWLAISTYWLAAYLGSRIQALLGADGGNGVPVIAAVFFSIISLSMLTERGGWTALKRVAFVPACLVGHAFLTVPVAAALGILVRDTEHVRSMAEQRAVFILASLPILACAMWRSSLFVISGEMAKGKAATRPTEPSP
jgi:hypothetical protein